VETFVVRVFTAAGGEPMPLRGVAEHIGSGTRDAFEGGAELIRLLEAKLPTRDRDEAQTKGEAR
jgi:hypothetical protein